MNIPTIPNSGNSEPKCPICKGSVIRQSSVDWPEFKYSGPYHEFRCEKCGQFIVLDSDPMRPSKCFDDDEKTEIQKNMLELSKCGRKPIFTSKDRKEQISDNFDKNKYFIFYCKW